MLRLGIGGEGGRRVTMEAIRRKEKEAEGKGKERLRICVLLCCGKKTRLCTRVFFSAAKRAIPRKKYVPKRG